MADKIKHNLYKIILEESVTLLERKINQYSEQGYYLDKLEVTNKVFYALMVKWPEPEEIKQTPLSPPQPIEPLWTPTKDNTWPSQPWDFKNPFGPLYCTSYTPKGGDFQYTSVGGWKS